MPSERVGEQRSNTQTGCSAWTLRFDRAAEAQFSQHYHSQMRWADLAWGLYTHLNMLQALPYLKLLHWEAQLWVLAAGLPRLLPCYAAMLCSNENYGLYCPWILRFLRWWRMLYFAVHVLFPPSPAALASCIGQWAVALDVLVVPVLQSINTVPLLHDYLWTNAVTTALMLMDVLRPNGLCDALLKPRAQDEPHTAFCTGTVSTLQQCVWLLDLAFVAGANPVLLFLPSHKLPVTENRSLWPARRFPCKSFLLTYMVVMHLFICPFFVVRRQWKLRVQFLQTVAGDSPARPAQAGQAQERQLLDVTRPPLYGWRWLPLLPTAMLAVWPLTSHW